MTASTSSPVNVLRISSLAVSVTRLARCFFPANHGESQPLEYRCFALSSSSPAGRAEIHVARILIPQHTTTIAEIQLAAVKAISNK
jgi:hypothetical protein